MARLTTLLAKHCPFRLLLCEGKFRYYPDGRLVVDHKSPMRFTRRQIRGILFDVRFVTNIDVDYTDDLDDTVNYIRWIVDSMNRSKHHALFNRPSAVGAWITPKAKDIHLWVLQAFPGIGPTLADNIIEYFGGIPLKWTCSVDELQRVARLSRERAKYLIDAFSTAPSEGSALTSLEQLKQRLRGK